MITIYQLQPDQIAANWPYMRGFLQSALEKQGTDQRYPLDYVLRELMTGASQSWMIVVDDKPVCAMVTELHHYPLGTAVDIFLLGGEDWTVWGDDLDTALMTYANQVGAKWVDTRCRKGIGKILSDYGYSYKYDFLSKEL